MPSAVGVATVAREGKPQDVGSIRIHAGAGTTIMQLNDGRPDDLGEQQPFEVDIMTDQDVAAFPRGVSLEQQAIDTKVSIKDRNKRFQKTGDGIGQFGLFARKATEAVFVEAIRFNERLNIDLVAELPLRGVHQLTVGNPRPGELPGPAGKAPLPGGNGARRSWRHHRFRRRK